ncbi:MAG: hypothetical protein GYA39_02925 [Methanothrix sp.]|nr:hypothetical protein [Methanothrix sp.]
MKASKKVIYDGVIGWVRPYLKGKAISAIDSDSKGLKKASDPIGYGFGFVSLPKFGG